jgi:hypothetical protein
VTSFWKSTKALPLPFTHHSGVIATDSSSARGGAAGLTAKPQSGGAGLDARFQAIAQAHVAVRGAGDEHAGRRRLRHEGGNVLAPSSGWSGTEAADQITGATAREAAKPAARRRLRTLIADLARDPACHGLAPKLADFLLHAPIVALRSIRPVSMARFWHATPEDTVELFLAAQRLDIIVMGWDLLCPRCRGAKARIAHRAM